SSQLLETLPLSNIKWICPTAPTRPVAILGGFFCTTLHTDGRLVALPCRTVLESCIL
ncbi:hypothetical protein S83_063141, partial [Arachis hypogaea]